MTTFNIIQQTDLATHEATIAQGMKTFVAVGQALAAIRDARLYRLDYATFEDYCAERWGMDRHYAHRMIQAAETVDHLLPTGNILPANERQARPLTSLPADEQPAVWQAVLDSAQDGKVTAAHVQRTVNEYLNPSPAPILRPGESTMIDNTIYYRPAPVKNSLAIHYSSDTPEHYTPSGVLSLVVRVMGEIDLDPCSNSKTNPNVPATEHYTLEDDGLARTWKGSVFLNPPYGRAIGDWVEKLCSEFEQGAVTQAIALVPARVDTAWWDRLTSTAKTYAVVCFVRGRLTFIGNDDPAPFPSAVVYLGDNRIEFYKEFSAIGRIWAQWDDEIAGMVCYG